MAVGDAERGPGGGPVAGVEAGPVDAVGTMLTLAGEAPYSSTSWRASAGVG